MTEKAFINSQKTVANRLQRKTGAISYDLSGQKGNKRNRMGIQVILSFNHEILVNERRKIISIARDVLKTNFTVDYGKDTVTFYYSKDSTSVN